MRYFQPHEFREWWPSMSPRLLTCLDLFRHLWGAPVRVSPHPQALGRHLGADSLSGHNIDRWGVVEAADLFPEGMDTADDMAHAYSCAIQAGASGIGLYTDTNPSDMIHLDTRPDRTPQNPRLWSRVNGAYRGIGEVMPEGWKR